MMIAASATYLPPLSCRRYVLYLATSRYLPM